MFSPCSSTSQLPNVESLAQWNSNGKSLIAQKLAQVIIASYVLIGISVAWMQK